MKTLITLLLATTALPAQDTQWEAGVIGLRALDSLEKVTYAKAGFGLSGGLRTHIPGTEVGTRLSLNLLNMPGKDFGTIRSSLRLAQVSGDILVAMPLPKLRAVLGFSLNQYHVTNSGTELLVPETDSSLTNPKPLRPVYTFAVRDASGTKMGLRLGFEWTWDAHWSTDLLLQTTELGGAEFTRPDPAAKVQGYTNRGPVNPAWIQATARYTF